MAENLPRRFVGRTVLVTGAGTGFGAEIAVRAAQEGAQVVVHYNRSREGAEQTLKRIEQVGSQGVLVQADITSWDAIRAMAEAAFTAFGRLDVAVNNVGDVARDQMSWRDITEESIDHVLAVDIKGTLLCTQEFGSRMLDAGGGCIINIGSTVVVRGSARAPQYAAAKYGILGITKSYAAAFAPTVRVNTFAPGFIETQATLNRQDWKAGRAEKLRSMTPMGRIPRPEEVAGTALFLATQDASHITGTYMVADGGYNMVGPERHGGGWPDSGSRGVTPDISLEQARALIERAIDKAEQLGLRGSVAVVGGSGVLVSASRMDASGAGGMARARSKAWIAATQQVPSAEHLRRMVTIAGPVAQGFVSCSPEANFPGAGGMPVHEGDLVVGGIAASGAAVSPFYPAGTDPMDMIADGVPANPEDLVVHYALGIPYVGQHGDDEKRWRDAFGDWPGEVAGRGMTAAPAAQAQPEHRWAAALADRVMAEAQRRGQRVAVAIADHRGDPIQQDWMPDAPTAAVAVAQAVAAAAGTFQCRSGELAAVYPDGPAGQLGAVLPYPILAAPGGLPVEEDGRVVAGLGVAGRDPGACEEIAAAVLTARRAR